MPGIFWLTLSINEWLSVANMKSNLRNIDCSLMFLLCVICFIGLCKSNSYHFVVNIMAFKKQIQNKLKTYFFPPDQKTFTVIIFMYSCLWNWYWYYFLKYSRQTATQCQPCMWSVQINRCQATGPFLLTVCQMPTYGDKKCVECVIK